MEKIYKISSFDYEGGSQYFLKNAVKFYTDIEFKELCVKISCEMIDVYPIDKMEINYDNILPHVINELTYNYNFEKITPDCCFSVDSTRNLLYDNEDLENLDDKNNYEYQEENTLINQEYFGNHMRRKKLKRIIEKL